jgi:hypothetical protein
VSSEPPPPVHIPALVQATKRGICWSDITDEIAREVRDRELQDNIETPEAA